MPSKSFAPPPPLRAHLSCGPSAGADHKQHVVMLFLLFFCFLASATVDGKVGQRLPIADGAPVRRRLYPSPTPACGRLGRDGGGRPSSLRLGGRRGGVPAGRPAKACAAEALRIRLPCRRYRHHRFRRSGAVSVVAPPRSTRIPQDPAGSRLGRNPPRRRRRQKAGMDPAAGAPSWPAGEAGTRRSPLVGSYPRAGRHRPNAEPPRLVSRARGTDRRHAHVHH
jgi:hypothetical protein